MAYAPSAPELPESFDQQQQQHIDRENRYSYAYPYQQTQQFTSSSGMFSPETPPDIIRSFESADRDRSGFLDESKLRHALSSFSGYQGISNKTIRFLLFIYKTPGDSLLRLGPKEYVELWKCLVQWRAIFDRYDKDRSGKMNSIELRDALYQLGYMLPTSVHQLIISQFDNGTSNIVHLCFNSFLECGMIVKGLTEKFKENDPSYTGYATLSYEVFMSMVIPYIPSYD